MAIDSILANNCVHFWLLLGILLDCCGCNCLFLPLANGATSKIHRTHFDWFRGLKTISVSFSEEASPSDAFTDAISALKAAMSDITYISPDKTIQASCWSEFDKPIGFGIKWNTIYAILQLKQCGDHTCYESIF